MKNVIIIKLGGNVVTGLNENFLQGIKDLQNEGKKVVIVHGGGESISHLLETMHIPFEKVDGIRTTSKEVLEVATMVLSGKVNKELVSQCTKAGLQALGLSGCDGQLLKVKKTNDERFGYVGEVEAVNATLVEQLLELNYVPIVSPIASDGDGQLYNVNADSAAVSLAIHLEAEELLYATDVEGVLHNEKVVPSLTKEDALLLKHTGIITGGMIPKVTTALFALEHQVKKVRIINGLQRFSKSSGTQFVLS